MTHSKDFSRFLCRLCYHPALFFIRSHWLFKQYMISEWIGFQLANVDLIRQKYSGTDFSFTSQAAHMQRLIQLKKEYETKGFHLQRLYCRRKKGDDGRYYTTMRSLMGYE